MTTDNVGKAVAALHRDGLVVLENAVDTNHMDELNGLLCSEAEEMAKLPTTHFNNVSLSSFLQITHGHCWDVHADKSKPELCRRETNWEYESRTSTCT